MIGCAFHAAELIFRNIFTQIDDTSKGPEKFSEPIGSCIDGDIHEIEPVNYKRIPNLFDIKIPEHVLEDLNWDQRMLFDHCTWISTG